MQETLALIHSPPDRGPPPAPPDIDGDPVMNLIPSSGTMHTKSFKDVLSSPSVSMHSGNQPCLDGSDSEDAMDHDDMLEKSTETSPGNLDIQVSITDGVPNIILSDAFEDRLARPWRQSVVVRMLGRSIGYNALLSRIGKLWNIHGSYKVIDLDNHYFLVQFTDKDDFLRSLLEGPWTIFGHYLVVQPWHPEFTPTKEDLTSVVAWVRLPSIALHRYDHRILKTIGNIIGKLVKIDANTERMDRGRFARIAVELDLTKPLLSQFMIKGIMHHIEYESIPHICFTCGRYGHDSSLCQLTPPQHHKSDDSNLNPSTALANNPVPSTIIQEDPKFGPWMVVQRKRRPVRKQIHYAPVDISGTVSTPSSFNVLSNAVESAEVPLAKSTIASLNNAVTGRSHQPTTVSSAKLSTPGVSFGSYTFGQSSGGHGKNPVREVASGSGVSDVFSAAHVSSVRSSEQDSANRDKIDLRTDSIVSSILDKNLHSAVRVDSAFRPHRASKSHVNRSSATVTVHVKSNSAATEERKRKVRQKMDYSDRGEVPDSTPQLLQADDSTATGSVGGQVDHIPDMSTDGLLPN